MLHFIDFESFKRLWTCVIICPSERKKTIIVNDKSKLQEYYDKYKKEIFVGYNIRGYDQYIFKGILCGFDPYEITKHIIVNKEQGYTFSDLFNKFPLRFYEVGNKFKSLKQYEGFLGNDIRETTIPFDYEGEFTQEMIDEVIYYNTHDVEQTIEVFLEKKADFDAQIDLIKTFNLPMSNISKTQAQLTAKALGCKFKEHLDEWEIDFVPTIKLNKYKFVKDWFEDPSNYWNGENFKVDVCGVPHVFALGGVHGAPNEPIHRKGLIIHVDVTSYYPSLMIEYDLLSRNVKDKQVFKDIYEKRVALKKAGKKKEQAPYKIILNSTFGITNDKNSLAYDPKRNHEVCINGQLLILDLLEKLEGHCELIQSNTDGLIIMIDDNEEAFDTIDDICWEWESRTGMRLGFDIIDEIYQKDVNNYVFRFENGKLERKGAYVKELSRLDNDLPIINKALVDRLMYNVPIEKTINDCDELIQFQKIIRISEKYGTAWHNGKQLNDKTFRVFASKDSNDGYIGKRKINASTIEKFANTPEHCFIDNRDINGAKVPSHLDRTYYIDMAKERLKQFGIN